MATPDRKISRQDHSRSLNATVPHWATRTGLAAVLRQQAGLQVAGEAETGAEAMSLAALLRPEIVLTDARMPDADAVDLTRRLLATARQAPATTPRVLLMIDSWDESLISALCAGATGVLLKSADVGQFVEAVEVANRGLPFMAPEVLRHLIDRLRGRTPLAVDSLTTRETEVLRLVGEGMSNAEIGQLLHVQESTVKYHISALIRKIGVRDRLQAAVFAHRSGMVAWAVIRTAG